MGVTAVSHLDIETRRCRTAFDEGTLTRPELEEFLGSAVGTVELVQANLNRAADLLQQVVGGDGGLGRVAAQVAAAALVALEGRGQQQDG